MTATTLSPYDIEKAIIAFIKADPDIFAAFGEEIRSINWNGTEFNYPALRLDTNALPEQPLNGNCKGKSFEFNFSVFIFANDKSPKTAYQNMGLVGKRFQNNVIRNTSPNFYTSPMTIGYINPISDGTTLWRGEVNVAGRLYGT